MSDRRASGATRNEDKPDPCEVKLNKGTREKKRLAEYKTKTNLFMLIGIVVQIVGAVIASSMEASTIGTIIRVGGAILFVIGCCYYAKGKGYHGVYGLFGLLSIIGLIVLVCMRDKCKKGRATM